MSPPFLLLGRHHAGTWLIALQLAIGVVLCLQAWQAVTGLHTARVTPDGIDDTGLLLVPWLQATPTTDPGVADVLRRLRSVPGVRAATASNQVPYGNSAWSVHVWTPARPAERNVVSVFLGEEHFGSTLGLATVRGRDFLPGEFRNYAGTQTDLHAGLGPAIISACAGETAVRRCGPARPHAVDRAGRKAARGRRGRARAAAGQCARRAGPGHAAAGADGACRRCAVPGPPQRRRG
ncbi:MAG: hypothetical protein QM795_14505 [Pseudoxanthomonas sp.]